jgi:hypothetical protein
VPKIDNFHPVELTYDSLGSAIATAELVFPYMKDMDDPSWPKYLFPASLAPNDPIERAKLDAVGVDTVNYWVVLDKHHEVDAFCGLYTLKDPEEAEAGEIWGGWTGVKPRMRGLLSIGQKLFQWTENEAIRRGAKVLKLYTSDIPLEAPAQKLFNQMGFETYKTVPVINEDPSKNYTLIYKSKQLT